jgi:hypothetical protein
MPTHIVEEDSGSTVIHHRGSGTSVLLLTIVGLAIIAIIVLVILHITLGIL